MPNLQALAAVPSFGGQLGQALGGGLSQGISAGLSQMLQSKKQRQEGFALAKYLGQPEMAEQIGALPREIQTEIAKAHVKQKQEKGLQDQEYGVILDDMENALENNKAGLAAYAGSFFNPELQETTAKFQSQGTALLGLAQNIALKQGIRNQREFDTFLKRIIPNESDTIGTAKGKINALRSYLKTGKLSGEESKGTSDRQEKEVMMRDPSGKLRKVPRNQAQEAQKSGYKLVQ